MLGLHKRERADTFTADGWYRTGDAGRFDEDGHFYFTGRMGDLIKSSGMNITPREVELVLEDHARGRDGVRDRRRPSRPRPGRRGRGRAAPRRVARPPTRRGRGSRRRSRPTRCLATSPCSPTRPTCPGWTRARSTGDASPRTSSSASAARRRCVGVTEFDPYSETFFEDPWEIYRWLRDDEPVYHHPELGFYAVSRYDDCVEVHRDHSTYTSTRGVTLDQLRSAAFGEVSGQMGSIIMMDPPMHERMRKLVNRAFTPRRIAEWESVVRDVIADLLDGWRASGSFDVVVDLSGPVPGRGDLRDPRRARRRPPAAAALDRHHVRARGGQPLPARRGASRRRSRCSAT